MQYSISNMLHYHIHFLKPWIFYLAIYENIQYLKNIKFDIKKFTFIVILL